MTPSSDIASAWTPAEEERLKISLKKSLANSVASLSNMLGVAVFPAGWGMLRASVKDPPLGLLSSDHEVCSIFMPIQGDLVGTCLLCFPVSSATSMLDYLLKQLGSSASPAIAGMLVPALEETGNVFLNEYIKILGQQMKIEIYPSMPRFEQGAWEKIWRKLANSQLSLGDKVLSLYGDFTWMSGQRLGQFFMCLSPDSWERLRYWAVQGKSLVTTVGLGALEVASAPTVLKVSDLGSCVALIVYDSAGKAGGMAHVMLPRAPSAAVGAAKPGKYADHAVTALIKKIKAARKTPAVWMVGGADMLTPFVSSLGSIGSKNVEVLRQELAQAGLPLAGEDVGGSQARTVELLTETGELWIKCGQRQRREQMSS